jgi:antitoxin (DNA-binding transcriptional repressor) of toxin-antitoxin stability system
MVTMTETEAAENFSKVLELVAKGDYIDITRDGEPIATVGRPFRPNGAKILAAYRNRVPDPDLDDVWEQVLEMTQRLEEVRDPWEEN